MEVRHLGALLNPTAIFVSSVKQQILPGVEMAVMTNEVQCRLCLQEVAGQYSYIMADT